MVVVSLLFWKDVGVVAFPVGHFGAQRQQKQQMSRRGLITFDY